MLSCSRRLPLKKHEVRWPLHDLGQLGVHQLEPIPESTKQSRGGQVAAKVLAIQEEESPWLKWTRWNSTEQVEMWINGAQIYNLILINSGLLGQANPDKHILTL